MPSVDPISASISFHPPGPAYLARGLFTEIALFIIPPHELTSYLRTHVRGCARVLILSDGETTLKSSGSFDLHPKLCAEWEFTPSKPP